MAGRSSSRSVATGSRGAGRSIQAEPQVQPQVQLQVQPQAQPQEINLRPRAAHIVLNMLNDPTFTDMTVFVGSEKKVFKLHRAVICIFSDFFKCAIGPGNFREASSGVIELPEVDHIAFSKAVDWMYGGDYTWFDSHNGWDVPAFEVANFLQLQNMRKAILNAIAASPQQIMASASKEFLEQYVSNFAKVCEFCNKSDLEDLESCARTIIPHWKVTREEIYDGLLEGKYGNTFVAAFLGAQKPALPRDIYANDLPPRN
ncbi:hypothetical protein TWF730_003629 [Orbilia blumenaviensis]|uniref:BTB domain-containing protein n=1 Tax=Orbilia blumenaviensis TaxID=1796055 RepID=A0AAV9U3G9_9PEZI